MHANGIEPCVKVRSNAEVRGKTLRDRVVRAYKEGKWVWEAVVCRELFFCV